MNPAITQCPECATRFRVSDEQLAAHDGMVRCGRCSNVFNAAEKLHNGQPNPQLDLPIAMPEEAPVTGHISGHDEIVAPSIAAIADEPDTLEHQFRLEEVHTEKAAKPARKQRRWPWIAGSLLLLLIFTSQVFYFYRIEIAARLPGLKPALMSYCELLQCTVPLPKKSDLMSIESSDLEADPLQANIITLSAVLHNRATHLQAYPSLELSLTDIQDKIVARRTFTPSEYLKTGESEKLGLTANNEIGIKLHLDTTDLKPAGYKLFLFYPQ